jgi:hypothetical protein
VEQSRFILSSNKIIGQIFGRVFRERCDERAFLFFQALSTKLDRVVDLVL